MTEIVNYKNCQVCGEPMFLEAYKCQVCNEVQKDRNILHMKINEMDSKSWAAIMFWILAIGFTVALTSQTIDILEGLFMFVIISLFPLIHPHLFNKKWVEASSVPELEQLIEYKRKKLRSNRIKSLLTIMIGVPLILYMSSKKPAYEKIEEVIISNNKHYEILDVKNAAFLNYMTVATDKGVVTYIGILDTIIPLPKAMQFHREKQMRKASTYSFD